MQGCKDGTSHEGREDRWQGGGGDGGRREGGGGEGGKRKGGEREGGFHAGGVMGGGGGRREGRPSCLAR